MTVQQLNINDAETIRLAQALADRLGSSLNMAVREALEAKLGAAAHTAGHTTAHTVAKPSVEATLDRVMAVRQHWRSEFDGQDLSLTHGDLLYDESGLPR